MRKSVRWPAVGLAVAAGLGILAVTGRSPAADAKAATSMYKPVVPTDVVRQLITDEAKSLQTAMGKAKEKTDKMATRAQSIALMVAVYAQDEALRGGSSAAAMAGLRDTALKLNKAINDGKMDDARKLAAEIKPAGMSDTPAKLAAVPVHADFEIDTLMQVFKPDRGGGLEWEKKLLMLRDKRSAYTKSDYDTLVPLMYRIATIAQSTEGIPPAETAKRKPEEWVKLAREMGDEAVTAAELARKAKPDDKMVKAAVKKLEATCTACHDKFRDTK
jgi:hypothetical protein